MEEVKSFEQAIELTQNSFVHSYVRGLEGRLHILESFGLQSIRDRVLQHDQTLDTLRSDIEKMDKRSDEDRKAATESRRKIFDRLDNIKLWLIGLLGSIIAALILEIIRMMK